MEFKSPGIIYGYSCRSEGNMSLNYGDTKDSLNNRRDYLSKLGIDYRNLVCAKQVHGSNIEYVTQNDLSKGALVYETAIDNADGLVTDERNVPLAIFTADCLSVFLYDALTPVLGLIHAGWRGSKENISGKAVQLMREKFGTDVKKLTIIFGPAMRKCCYRVEEDFRKFFSQDVLERDGSYYLDLAGVNKRQVLAAGAGSENIFDSGVCTFCQNKQFFSFRLEGASSGRMISVGMLK